MSIERAQPAGLFVPAAPWCPTVYGIEFQADEPIGCGLAMEYLARAAAAVDQPADEPASDDPGDVELVAGDVCPYPAGWPRPEVK